MRGMVTVALMCVAAWAGIAQAAGPPSGVADRVQELERVLGDWRLGCEACPVRLGWDDAQLALFVAGRLSSLGFQTELARSEGEWWVLVRLRAEGTEVVVPVLPGFPPLDRNGQFARGVFLGRIPWAEPGRPDPRYLAPEEVLPLPPNPVPEVRLRVHPTEPRPGEAVWFIADVADLDGSVIQLRWDFGDGESSSWWSPEHVYGREGTYTVTLTVVDDRGGVAEARIIVSVTAPPAPPPGGSGGCGCGG